MSNFRSIDRQTGFLLPPSVDEWLPEKHLARFVVEVIDGLDLRGMRGELSRLGLGVLPAVAAAGHPGLCSLRACNNDEHQPGAKTLWDSHSTRYRGGLSYGVHLARRAVWPDAVPQEPQAYQRDFLSACHGPLTCRSDCIRRKRAASNRVMHCRSWPIPAMLISDMMRTCFYTRPSTGSKKPAKSLRWWADLVAGAGFEPATFRL
jgi:hypothetical protein